MRVTKAQLVKTCDQFAADIEKLRKERDMYRGKHALQEGLIRALERKIDDSKFREERVQAELAAATRETDADRERDRDALLTAENRVCELEAAIVSLAVRVA